MQLSCTLVPCRLITVVASVHAPWAVTLNPRPVLLHVERGRGGGERGPLDLSIQAPASSAAGTMCLAMCAELPRRVKTCRGIACACVPPRAAARDTRLNQPNCRVRLILDSSEARACGRLASFRLTRALPSRAFGLADVPARARAIIDDNGTHVPVPGPGTDRARVRTGGCSGSRLSPRAPRGVADRPDRSSRSSSQH